VGAGLPTGIAGVEAFETSVPEAGRAYLETCPLVGDHRLPSAAARLSHAFLVLDDEGAILELHDTGLFKAGNGPP
jgi:hypothetical protein